MNGHQKVVKYTKKQTKKDSIKITDEVRTYGTGAVLTILLFAT